jgi:hypothetical protein
MEEAVHELQRLITARFPQAAFAVEEGCDPEGIYLVTTVDIADTDEVTAVVGDRLVELQVEEGLPVYVTPLRPIMRVVAQLRNERRPRRQRHCRSHKETSGQPGFLMKAPRSKLRGIKTQNPEPSKQLHLDVLTMELPIRFFAALLLDILTDDCFVAMTSNGTDKVAFGPKFATP